MQSKVLALSAYAQFSSMELSGSSTGPVPIRTLTDSANNLLCLLEDSANDLMQMLENNMPLTSTLHALH